MTELEAVKERHSVRNYLDKPIESEKIEVLKKAIAEVNEEGNLNLQFIEKAGKTFNRLLTKVMGLGSAPSVIACVGKDAEDLSRRIGYYGQKIVLLAQTLGLNTCFAGTFNKDKTPAVIGDGEKLVIVIAIGYGENGGRVRRSKAPQDVSNIDENSPQWFKSGVEAALLAPTAINQQKFYITLEKDGSVSYKDLGGPFSQVDLGIVKYNFEVGSK